MSLTDYNQKSKNQMAWQCLPLTWWLRTVRLTMAKTRGSCMNNSFGLLVCFTRLNWHDHWLTAQLTMAPNLFCSDAESLKSGKPVRLGPSVHWLWHQASSIGACTYYSVQPQHPLMLKQVVVYRRSIQLTLKNVHTQHPLTLKLLCLDAASIEAEVSWHSSQSSAGQSHWRLRL